MVGEAEDIAFFYWKTGCEVFQGVDHTSEQGILDPLYRELERGLHRYAGDQKSFVDTSCLHTLRTEGCGDKEGHRKQEDLATAISHFLVRTLGRSFASDFPLGVSCVVPKGAAFAFEVIGPSRKSFWVERK